MTVPKQDSRIMDEPSLRQDFELASIFFRLDSHSTGQALSFETYDGLTVAYTRKLLRNYTNKFYQQDLSLT